MIFAINTSPTSRYEGYRRRHSGIQIMRMKATASGLVNPADEKESVRLNPAEAAAALELPPGPRPLLPAPLFFLFFPLTIHDSSRSDNLVIPLTGLAGREPREAISNCPQGFSLPIPFAVSGCRFYCRFWLPFGRSKPPRGRIPSDQIKIHRRDWLWTGRGGGSQGWEH